MLRSGKCAVCGRVEGTFSATGSARLLGVNAQVFLVEVLFGRAVLTSLLSICVCVKDRQTGKNPFFYFLCYILRVLKKFQRCNMQYYEKAYY
jgi:hypothetical protein